MTMCGAVVFVSILGLGIARRRRKSQKETAPPVNPPTAAAEKSAPPDLNITVLSKQKPPERPVSPPLAANPAPKPGLVSTPGPPPPTPAPPPPANSGELLRLLRDPASGQLLVEVAGRRYTKLAEVSDKKTGQHILMLAAHLLHFTGGMVATSAGLKSLAAPVPDRVPEPLGQDTSPGVSTSFNLPSPAPPEIEAALLAALQKPPVTPEPVRRGLLGRPRLAAESALPGLNLADEINTIAQMLLIASPLAATTDLKITADPGGGIRIKINGAYYSGPDEVPMPEVKDLIKTAIRQWERT
jgi:hypothetical protein